MRVNPLSIAARRLALAALLALAIGSPASAQASAASTPLERVLTPFMTVWITDASGRERKVRIVSVGGDLVTTAVADRIERFRTSDILRVRVRRSDSLVDGALIGAGAAVASGLFLCTRTEPWENCRDDVGPMLRVAAIGAGIGLAVDALIRGRKTIYEADRGSTRVHAAPFVGGRAGGVQVSLSF